MDVEAREEGSALIELCLLAPIIFVVFLAATDLCFYIQSSIVVNDAASVGARFGSVAGNQTNTSGMQAAAMTAANGLSGFTATATSYCTCNPGGSQISCNSSCPSLPTPVEYVEVTTHATVPVLFKVTSIPASIQLSATSILRVNWASQ